MKEKEYMPEVEVTWESVLDRYIKKIEDVRSGLKESDKKHLVLNIIDTDMPILFKKYKEGNYSVTRVKDDLKHMMESITDEESDEYLAYRTIWEMIDGRQISL